MSIHCSKEKFEWLHVLVGNHTQHFSFASKFHIDSLTLLGT